jgi:hypothetical protein
MMNPDFKNFIDTIKSASIPHEIEWATDSTREKWQKIILDCGYNVTALATVIVRVGSTDFMFCTHVGTFMLLRDNATGKIEKRSGEQLRYATSREGLIPESQLFPSDMETAFPASKPN